MKYIIDVPEEIAKISEEFLSKAGLLCEPYTDIDIKEKAEEFGRGYDAGWDAGSKFHEAEKESIEDEVWGFAWEVLQLDLPVFREIFGCDTDKMDYRDYKSKYEAWLKQKGEISVGDEVKDHEDIKAVVLDIGMDGEVYTVYTENRICEDWLKDEGFVKTGRHFDEVAELLEKMRGEEE